MPACQSQAPKSHAAVIAFRTQGPTFCGMTGLRKETANINRISEEEFERVEAEDQL